MSDNDKPASIFDPRFVYTRSNQTDIRKTFDRARQLLVERGVEKEVRGESGPGYAFGDEEELHE